LNKTTRYLFIVLSSSLLLTTGCWDRKELNEQALIFAWGMDVSKDKGYQSTAQFAIPYEMEGSSGGDSKAFFTISGTGKSVYEAAKDMQTKVSRSWFAGHRRVIVIGEKLAQQGLSYILDEYTRNPIVRMRSDMLVLKDDSVEHFLKLPYPLEQLSATALIRIHESAELKAEQTLRNFLMAAASDASCPLLPVVSTQSDSLTTGPKQQSSGLKLWGMAIFNKELKLVKYMPLKKGLIIHWVRGEVSSGIRVVKMSGQPGDIVVEASHMKVSIKPTVTDNNIQFNVKLSGNGMVRENNTNMDLSKSNSLFAVQKAMNKQTEKEVLDVIRSLQELGTDVLGFGDALHRKYPSLWKKMKTDWGKQFTEADVKVTAHLRIMEAGLTGSPLSVKEKQLE